LIFIKNNATASTLKNKKQKNGLLSTETGERCSGEFSCQLLQAKAGDGVADQGAGGEQRQELADAAMER
jgi:hypothetical protein